jgi:MFS family permease
MTPEELGLYYYYVGWFVALLIILVLFNQFTPSTSSTAPSKITSPEFKRFQTTYLLVYLIMMAADWLQGPYVYALYSHYGFSIGEIALLFIIGFGSSLFFGTIVGSMSDKYGRKKLCIVFGVLYSMSCLTKHFNNFHWLLFGRLLGGISTSILFSSFESWMVHEHHAKSYSDDWLGVTFSLATAGNGAVAIASGVAASLVRDQFGPVAPFDLSLILLLIGTTIVAFTWTENTGDSSINLTQTLTHAFSRLRADRKIALLGIIQSFFEGSMYVFVFMWTPALASTSSSPIYHGWIFASFMISVLIGSSLFQYLLNLSIRVERIALYMFCVAGASLLLPAFTTSHSLRFFSFCTFEVCVGMFWPCLGFMRSRYVPEEVRATVMNMFRIPLNLIVVLVLMNIDRLEQRQVFWLCFACMVPAVVCQWRLCEMVLDAPEVTGKKGETGGLLEEGVKDDEL